MALSSQWKISIAGASPVSCASLGMRNVRVENINMATSTLTFTIESSNILTATNPMTEGNSVALWNGAVVHFVGRVTSITTVGMANAQQWQYVVSNAWYYLERIMYLQPIVYGFKSGTTWFLGQQMSSRGVLFKDFWSRPITVQQQIDNILLWASYRGAGGLAIGGLATIGSAPYMEFRDITCAEAIRRCLLWSPNAVVYWGYGTGAEVLNVTPRSGLSAGNIDLLDTTKSVEVEEINPRYDLNVPGVSITFMSYAQDSAPPAGDGLYHGIYSVQSAGSPDQAGGLYATVDLQGQGTSAYEVGPNGNIALQIYQGLQGSKWAGRIKITESECSGTLQLGMALNLLNGRTEWATMNGVIQQIIEDIDNGTTEVVFGPPGHISPQDFVSMLLFTKGLNVPAGTAPTLDNGTVGAGTTAPGGIPGVTGGGAAPDPGNQPPWTPAGTGGGAAVANPNAGTPPAPAGVGAGIFGKFPTVGLTLCDNSKITVLTTGH